MQTQLKIQQSPIVGALPPNDLVGAVLPNGDAVPFSLAPVGTRYLYKDATNKRVRLFVKRKNDQLDNDWGIEGGLHCITKTIAFSQFTDGGGTTGTYVLGEKIPIGAFSHQTLLTDVTGFTGNVSATITVGDGSDVDRYNTGTPSVFTTATMVAMGVPSGVKEHLVETTITVTVTASSDFTLIAAGSLTLKIFYLF